MPTFCKAFLGQILAGVEKLGDIAATCATHMVQLSTCRLIHQD